MITAPLPATSPDAVAGNESPEQERWTDTVRSTIDTLRTVASGTEAGFVGVGSRLQDVHGRTMAVSTRLSNAVAGFSTEGGDSSVDRLRNVATASQQAVEQFNGIATRAIDDLSTLLTTIARIAERLNGFDRLVSQLRIMGIATRIETARLGLLDLGFEHLADEVVVLGETISTKAKEVQGNIRTIVGLITVNKRTLLVSRDRQEELRRSVVHRMTSDLHLLSEKHEALEHVVRQIALQSADAVKTLESIVSAVQFHDITRQQIEHVVSSLEEASQPAGSDADSSALTRTIVVCELQALQLRRTLDEYDAAVLSIITSFGTLANTVAMMQAESSGVVGFAEETGSTFFADIAEHLTSVTSALTEGDRAIREFNASLESIGDVVARMEKYMAEMDGIGVDIELLALNSRVRAAKAHETGAALGVIAEAIQRLSFEAQTYISTVVQDIGGLITVTDDMRQLARSSEREIVANAGFSAADSDLRRLTESFRVSSTSGAGILHQTDVDCGTLRRDLEGIALMVQDSRAVTETMRAVGTSLAEVAASARSVAPPVVLSEVEAHLASLTERYTMHTERDLHTAYLEGRDTTSGAGDPSAGSVELF